MEERENSYIEMLVVYKDDKDDSKPKLLIPIHANNTHYEFINRRTQKIEFINRLNVVRMEEKERVSLDLTYYQSKNVAVR